MTEAVPVYNDVLEGKRMTNAQIQVEYLKLKKYKPKLESRCFAGNPILYHFQMDNLCRVETKAGSFYNMMMDDKQREEWWVKINKYACGSRPDSPAIRFFEIYRRCTGAVVFFKPTIAINIYSQVNATAVLDPCAGWGGRMLGALAKNIAYTGIDTNMSLKPAYDEMMAMFPGNATMIWQDSLKVDFSQIDYDCVLTSPPYVNLEVYPGMSPFPSDNVFYKEFLIPLIDKCRASIRRGGKVCFNISPKMYSDLLSHGYTKCLAEVPMLQQKIRGKDKEDMIYCW